MEESNCHHSNLETANCPLQNPTLPARLLCLACCIFISYLDQLLTFINLNIYLKQSYTYKVKVRNMGENSIIVFVILFTCSIAQDEVFFLLFTKKKFEVLRVYITCSRSLQVLRAERGFKPRQCHPNTCSSLLFSAASFSICCPWTISTYSFWGWAWIGHSLYYNKEEESFLSTLCLPLEELGRSL